MFNPVKTAALFISIGLLSSDLYAQLNLISSTPDVPNSGIQTNETVVLTFDAPTPADIADGIAISSRFRGTIDGSWTGAGTATIEFTPSEALWPGDLLEFSGSTGWTSSTSETLNSFLLTTRVTGLTNDAYATGNFWTTQNSWSNDTVAISDVTSADFNGDGILDLAGVWGHQWNNDPGQLKVAFGNGDGTFGAFNEQVTDLSRAKSLKARDLDQDGDVDLVLNGRGGTSPLRWVLNDGTGQFSGGSFVTGTTWWVDLADLDGDGDPDLVTTSTTSVKLYRNDLSDGGGMTLWATLTNDYYYTYAPVFGDFDGDGDQDIAASSLGWPTGGYPEKWFWLENTGDVSTGWVEHVIQQDAGGALTNINEFKSGDVDGDGDVDLVGDGGLFFENDGTGTFALTQVVSGASSFELVDFDADGDLDIAASFWNNWSRVFRNDGSGAFTGTTIVNSFENMGGFLDLADYDGDGLMDMLVTAGDDYTNQMGIYHVLPLGGSILDIQPAEGAASLTGQIPTQAGTITERGFVYGTTPAPTTADTQVIDASTGPGTFTANVTGLDGNTTYYARSYAVVNGVTRYSPEYSFNTPLSFSYSVGDVGPAGGIIFFVDENDEHPGFDYLELSPVDLQVDRPWGCQGDGYAPLDFPNPYSIGTADMSALGDGAPATAMIVAGCDETPHAAQYADSVWVVENGAFFDDWFLPAKDEFSTLRDALAGDATVWDSLGFVAPIPQPPYTHWTATEWFDTGSAQTWSGQYSNFFGALGKSLSYKVRPMRAFAEEPTFGASEPTPLLTAALADTMVCSGGADVVIDLSQHFTAPVGSLTFSVTGGPAGSEFTASVSGSNLTIDFSGAGDDATAVLTVTAEDDNGDTLDAAFTVTELASVSITETVTDASSWVATDGEIELVFDGGAPAASTSGPCYGETSVTYFGVEYTLHEVGDQCWFGQNLQTTQFNDGTSLTQETGNGLYSNGTTTPMYADPEGGASNLTTDGYFYSAAALTSTENNLCPSGYHVPNRLEVLALNTGSDAAFTEGSAALGDTVTGTWSDPFAGLTNASGMTFRPSGVRANVIYAYGDGTKAWMGTSELSTTAGKINVGTYYVSSASTSLYTQSLNDKYGYPTRCLKDAGTPQSGYSPVWDHGPTTAALSGLTAGDYDVTVTDEGGCTATAQFTISSANLNPVADSLAADTVCFGAAALTLDLDTVFAGDPSATPLTYSVTGGPAGGEFSGSVSGSLLIVSFDAAGGASAVRDTLFLTATDDNGLTGTMYWVLMEQGEIALSGSTTDLSELGSGDGAIDITASGVSFAWADGPTTEDRIGLDAGTYSLTVTDATTGCTASDSFTLTEPGQMELSGTWRISPASSASAGDGGIDASFINGAGARTVTVQVGSNTFDMDFGAGEDFSWTLPAGVYYILGFSDAAGSETVYSPALRIVVPHEKCD